jgi:hypothetical protein
MGKSFTKIVVMFMIVFKYVSNDVKKYQFFNVIILVMLTAINKGGDIICNNNNTDKNDFLGCFCIAISPPERDGHWHVR